MAGDCPAASVLLAFAGATIRVPSSRAPAHRATAGGRARCVASGNAPCVCEPPTPDHGRGLPNGERPSFAAEPRAAAAKDGRELHRRAIHPRGWPGRVREGGTPLLLHRLAVDGDAAGGGQRSAAPRRPHGKPAGFAKVRPSPFRRRVGPRPLCPRRGPAGRPPRLGA